VPSLSDQACRIDRHHSFTQFIVAEADRTRDLSIWLERGPIERRKEFRCVGLAGSYAAADPMKNVPALRPIGDAETGSREQRRDFLQIGEALGRRHYPVELILLQPQIPRDHIGNLLGLQSRGSVGRKNGIAEAAAKQHADNATTRSVSRSLRSILRGIHATHARA
jgi:hypothetical protein